MDSMMQKDLKRLDRLLGLALDESLDFLKGIDRVSTTGPGTRPYARSLESKGLGGEQVLQEFLARFRPHMVASTGPRYWGFVTGGSTPAAIMGDWLVPAYDQNPQAVQGQGDVSAQIEVETIHLFLDLLRLPKTFGGGFVSGAMMSNFTCLATARQWVGQEYGMDVAQQGLHGCPPPRVLGSSPHSSSIKALSLLGLGRDNFIHIPAMARDREAMDMGALEERLAAMDGGPCILVSSAATVNTGDFDDFARIAELRSKYRFWWHIDAAFGGLVACSPKYCHLLQGWEGADSITVDCHKWLNVPYENAVFLIKAKHRGCQMDTFRNSHAPYLGTDSGTINFLNLLPENSRRLKALPVWFTLLAYGREGYRALVENCIVLAQDLGRRIQSDPRLELLAPVHLNIVPFTVRNLTDRELDAFLMDLNGRGKLFLTPTVLQKRKGFRAALVNWRTQQGDVDLAMEEIRTSLMAIGVD